MSLPAVHKIIEQDVTRFLTGDLEIDHFNQRIKAIIENQSQHLPTQIAFSNLMNKFVSSSLDLLNFNDAKDYVKPKLAGLVIFDCLLDVNDEIMPERRIEITNHIFKVIENDKQSIVVNNIVLKVASSSIGHFARVASTSEAEFLQNFYFPQAVKLIGNTKSESHRYAGALVFTQLALNSAALIFSKRKTLFGVLWEVVNDKNAVVRAAGASALEASLHVISQREGLLDYLKSAFRQIDAGFTSNLTEKVIGSLIILDTIVNGSIISVNELHSLLKQMNLSMQEVIWKVLQRKDFRDGDVRQKIFEIIPNLANCFSSCFLQSNNFTNPNNFLNFILQHIISSIRAKKERAVAYAALGKLFVCMASYFRTLTNIHDLFQTILLGFLDQNFCVEALTCMGLAANVSTHIRKLINNEVISFMFNGGLSAQLVDTLNIILRHVPAVRIHVLANLRNQICRILGSESVCVEARNKPITSPSSTNGTTNTSSRSNSITTSSTNVTSTTAPAPSPVQKEHRSSMWNSGGNLFGSSGRTSETHTTTSAAANSLSMAAAMPMDADIPGFDRITFALQVVASPDFFQRYFRDKMVLNETESEISIGISAISNTAPLSNEKQTSDLLILLRDYVVKFLDDFDEKIRRNAVKACATILDTVALTVDYQLSSSFEIAQFIIDRLLLLGIGDESPEIRLLIFKSIAPTMDHIVSFSNQIYCVIDATTDECLPVRAASMTVLSRIARYDPIHIMPFINVCIKELISSICMSTDHVVKQESVTILQAVVRGSESLIIPYIDQIIGPLLTLLKDPSQDVVVAVLSTVGELAQASPASVCTHLDELAPRLIEALKDSSFMIKQETAVVAMGKLVSSFAMVTEEPYKKYSGLFDGLVRAVQSVNEESAELRLQAIRTLGLLGAVDPVVHEQHLILSNPLRSEFNSSTMLVMDNNEDIDSSTEKGENRIPFSAGDKKLSSIEENYFSVVIRELMNILKDSSLSYHHLNAAGTAMKTIKFLGLQAACQLHEVMSAILFRLYQSESGNNIKDALLDHLITLVNIMGFYMVKYIDSLIQVIIDFFDTHTQSALDIFEALSICLPLPEFEHVILPKILPFILKSLDNEISVNEQLLTDSVAVGNEIDTTTVGAATNSSSSIYMKTAPNTSTNGRNNSVVTSTYSNKNNQALMAMGQKTMKILQKFVNMTLFLRSYHRELMSTLLKIFENSFSPLDVRKETLSTIMYFLEDQSLIEESASRVIHTCLNVISTVPDPTLVATIITSLTCFVCRLGGAYLPFVIPVHRKLKGLSALIRELPSVKPRVDDYDSTLTRLLQKRQVPFEPNDISDIVVKYDERVKTKGTSARMAIETNFQIAVQSLETAWALADRSSAINLIEWMRRLTIELIRQSPSSVIRSCAALAKTHRPLAEELFNASFHSVWDELFSSNTNDVVVDIPLINNIEMALQSPQIPKNIMISLLNLAEFMDIQDKPLPLNICIVARQAQAANMFAKCLRYREIEFKTTNVTPSLECVDALITVCNQVGLPDRAIGLLRYLKKSYPLIEIQPQWLEKLHRWDDANYAYELNIQHVIDDVKLGVEGSNGIDAQLVRNEKWLCNELGRMRCLRALGEYEDLIVASRVLKNQIKSLDLLNEFIDTPIATATPATTASSSTITVLNHSAPSSTNIFNTTSPLQQPGLLYEEVQRLGAHAAWMLGEWEVMDDFLDVGNAANTTSSLHHFHQHSGTKDIFLGNNLSFYSAIYAIHSHDYDKATVIINETRNGLSSSISSLLSENYSRAYRAMLTMQMLAEMEEVIDYKKVLEKLTVEHSADTGSNAASVVSTTISTSSEYAHMNSHFDMKDKLTTPNAATTLSMEISAKKNQLLQRWRGRMKWAPKDIDVYRQILTIHGLVTEPLEDLDSWLELVALCRKEGMFKLCSSVLRKLGGPVTPYTTIKPPTTIHHSPAVTNTNTLSTLTPVATDGNEDGTDDSVISTKVNDRVLLSTYQYWWSIGEKEKALKHISNFLRKNSTFTDSSPPPPSMSGSLGGAQNSGSMFRVKCLLKKATWMRELEKDDISEILATLVEARESAKEDYWVWHAWASANYDQLKKADSSDSKTSFDADANATVPSIPVFLSPPFGYHSNSNPNLTTPTSAHKPLQFTGKLNYNTPKKFTNAGGTASLLNLLSMQQTDKITPYITEAIKGYVRSIVLGQGQLVANLLQDTLRLITLWFSYGTKKGVLHILEAELEKVPANNWLSVVPQLIARIHLKSNEISGILRKLLCKVAHAHPQALVWPISVALNTTDQQQRIVATEVLLEMRKNKKQLVEEATLVSRELMKVAITPHELWYDGLEQAAQFYMDNQDINAMMTVLRELHETLTDQPLLGSTPDNKSSNVPGANITAVSEGFGKIGYTSLRDNSFRQMYTKPLNDAFFWLEQFRNTGRTMDLHQAWETYQAIFKRIKTQIQALKKLELHHVSPALTTAKDLSLAVPGTYKPSCEDICITSFSPSITVISSKQRPRRIAVHGSDGKQYLYLLKGHEDLRQDERVMQLFGLINVCLQNDRITNDRNLNIIRYSVLPLSNNSGLIGWVEHCDTMNQLVKQYRESRDIRLLLELKLLSQKSKNYDKLPLIHKVNLFREVLEETTGQDLAKIMWLNSKTSDVWIERRANFTRSIAVMSMVGYILGLGDRHPSNLMVHRMSGQVVHIDFGDCFEITAHRSKYPEIIPFRLTRMITNCMEVTGMEGSYRLSSERVIRVLRENRDSVMAMLEAFVYDPLISWRLLAKDNDAEISRSASNDTDLDVSKQRSPVEKLGNALNTSTSTVVLSDHDFNDLAAPGDLSPKRTPAPGVSLRDIGTVRRAKSQEGGGNDDEPLQENLNARALEVINRIQAKLTGRDFLKETDDDADNFTIEQQVDRLIMEATDIENLCQLFSGWCPLW